MSVDRDRHNFRGAGEQLQFIGRFGQPQRVGLMGFGDKDLDSGDGGSHTRFRIQNYFYGVDCGQLRINLRRWRFNVFIRNAAADWSVEPKRMIFTEQAEANGVNLDLLPEPGIAWIVEEGVVNVEKVLSRTSTGKNMEAAKLLVRASTTINPDVLKRMGVVGETADMLIDLARDTRRNPQPVTFVGVKQFKTYDRHAQKPIYEKKLNVMLPESVVIREEIKCDVA